MFDFSIYVFDFSNYVAGLYLASPSVCRVCVWSYFCDTVLCICVIFF